MHDEENGKEKGKKDDVKHCPEVEKKVSPAFRCPPWFFSYVEKGAVPSGVEQVVHHWVTDELRKKFVDTLFYTISRIWIGWCLVLIRGEPHRGRHREQSLASLNSKQFLQHTVTHPAARHVLPFCSYHILTSSVIYNRIELLKQGCERFLSNN